MLKGGAGLPNGIGLPHGRQFHGILWRCAGKAPVTGNWMSVVNGQHIFAEDNGKHDCE